MHIVILVERRDATPVFSGAATPCAAIEILRYYAIAI